MLMIGIRQFLLVKIFPTLIRQNFAPYGTVWRKILTAENFDESGLGKF